MAGYSPATNCAGLSGYQNAVPQYLDVPTTPEPETLAGNVQHALTQLFRIESLASEIESALFRQSPTDGCRNSIGKEEATHTIHQNADRMLARVYSTASILENLRAKIGGC